MNSKDIAAALISTHGLAAARALVQSDIRNSEPGYLPFELATAVEAHIDAASASEVRS